MKHTLIANYAHCIEIITDILMSEMINIMGNKEV